MPKNQKNDFDFKSGLERLEEIVESLEAGEIALEEALKAFEEGITISKDLSARLEKAEKQVRLLVEKEDGSLETEVMEELKD